MCRAHLLRIGTTLCIIGSCVRCTHTPTYTTADAFARWQVWAAQEGAEVLSLKAFGQALDRRGFSADPSRRRRRYGIGLLAEEEAP